MRSTVPGYGQPYSTAQVDNAVALFTRLVATIEEHIPAESLSPQTSGTLLSDADLDTASVPRCCFARQFLARCTIPRFNAIAPGLVIPHNAAGFVTSQKLTRMDAASEDGTVIPSVLLFAAANGAIVNLILQTSIHHSAHSATCLEMTCQTATTRYRLDCTVSQWGDSVWTMPKRDSGSCCHFSSRAWTGWWHD